MELKKTQAEMAQLLGVSIKAIHSYEQGWRTIPTHAERQLFFLVSRLPKDKKGQKFCWTVKSCPENQKKNCPAWEFNAGKLCWFISGTICEGFPRKKWKDKIKVCRECDVFQSALNL